jgi:DNA adenine methylase
VDLDLGYLGSKAVNGAYQAVIANMPPHDTYIETHLGSGIVMLRKPPALRSIGLEIDPKTLASFTPITDVETYNVDCLDFLRTFDFASAARVLVYSDPPYVMTTRARKGPRYRFDYTDADHEALLALLGTLPASVIISGYQSDLYANLLPAPQWRSLSYQVGTRGGPRTETLWMNYAADAAHWADHAGVDFTDRQRIKRKAARWQRNYRELPAGERMAVLAAILEPKV